MYTLEMGVISGTSVVSQRFILSVFFHYLLYKQLLSNYIVIVCGLTSDTSVVSQRHTFPVILVLSIRLPQK
jgi:hypothetical protein